MSRARGNEALYFHFGINHLYELAFFQADLPEAWAQPLTSSFASFYFHHLLMFVILIFTMFIIVFILLMNDQ